MTHLRIENQDSNVEIVSAAIILKLYNLALDIEENLEEGESLSDYVSLKGNLLSDHAKLTAYEYLTGNLPDTSTKRFPNLTINLTGGTYIDFADPEVERVLLANNIGDGVGVTSSLIHNVTGLDGVGNFRYIRLNTNITSFIELMNFDLITYTSNAPFYYCTNLKKLGLPGNIIEFGEQTFLGVKLEKLIFKNTINNFLKSSWYGRDAVPTLADSSGIKLTDLCINSEDNIIYDITYPTDAIIPLCNTSIKSITFETGRTAIPDNCIEYCPDLETVVIPDTVTDLGNALFYSCPKLKFLDIPSQVNVIRDYALSGGTTLDAVIIRATTPPTILGRTNLLDSVRIYVPLDSVETYKTTWSQQASKIFSISQYAIDYPSN